MNWDLTDKDGVAVLAVRGNLVEGKFTRLVAACAWVSAHSTGPLILDLRGLRNCAVAGQAALAAACRGWAAEGRAIVVCVPPKADLRLDDEEFRGFDRYARIEDALTTAHTLAPMSSA